MGKTIDDLSKQLDSRIADVDKLLKMIMLELVSREAENTIQDKANRLPVNNNSSVKTDGTDKGLQKGSSTVSPAEDQLLNTIAKVLKEKRISVKAISPLKLGKQKVALVEFNSKVTAALAGLVVAVFENNKCKYKPIIVAENLSMTTIKVLKGKNISYIDLYK